MRCSIIMVCRNLVIMPSVVILNVAALFNEDSCQFNKYFKGVSYDCKKLCGKASSSIKNLHGVMLNAFKHACSDHANLYGYRCNLRP